MIVLHLEGLNLTCVLKFHRRLPDEIRVMIIRLIVTQPDGVVNLEPARLRHCRMRRWLQVTPDLQPVDAWASTLDRLRFMNCNLILASKSINAYAMHEMYTKQKFHFTRLCALQTFLLPLRPETMDLIRHVEVMVGSNEWNMMPAIAALLAKLRFLDTLVIHGICEYTSNRCVGRHLNGGDKPLNGWPVSEESFDKIHGIKLARDMYPFLYPLFNPIIRAQPAITAANDVAEAAEVADPGLGQPSAAALGRSKSKGPSTLPYEKAVIDMNGKERKPIAGAQKLMQVLRFTEIRRSSFWSFLPYPRWTWLNTLLMYHAAERSFRNFTDASKDDKQRQSTIMTAMGEELVKMVAQDTY